MVGLYIYIYIYIKGDFFTFLYVNDMGVYIYNNF